VKPYYDHLGITIYHGDCREILPLLPTVDVVLTDPPWPLAHAELMAGNNRAAELFSEIAPLLRAKRLIVWLAIHNDPRLFLNALPAWPYLRAVYIRRAIPGYNGRVLLDGEMVHVLGEWPPARAGRMVIPGGLSITYAEKDRENGHPGPRSLIATRFLVKWWSDEGDVFLDPFMGSGTVLCAAKELKRRAIGIEIEEKYCEIAAKRLSQEVLTFP
jgi:site-specific DNA-methyltransferase (adenine-specific)